MTTSTDEDSVANWTDRLTLMAALLAAGLLTVGAVLVGLGAAFLTAITVFGFDGPVDVPWYQELWVWIVPAAIALPLLTSALFGAWLAYRRSPFASVPLGVGVALLSPVGALLTSDGYRWFMVGLACMFLVGVGTPVLVWRHERARIDVTTRPSRKRDSRMDRAAMVSVGACCVVAAIAALVVGSGLLIALLTSLASAGSLSSGLDLAASVVAVVVLVASSIVSVRLARRRSPLTSAALLCAMLVVLAVLAAATSPADVAGALHGPLVVAGPLLLAMAAVPAVAWAMNQPSMRFWWAGR